MMDNPTSPGERFMTIMQRVLDDGVQRILNEPYHINIRFLKNIRRKRSERRSVTKR